MPVSKPTDPVSRLAGAAVARDNQLQKRTRQMFERALAETEYILDHGTDAQKASFIKAVVPTMMKSLEDEKANAEVESQRAAYQRLREAMRGDTKVVKRVAKKPAPAKKAAARPRKAAAKTVDK